MAISSKRQYQFSPPSFHQELAINDFVQGLNTRDEDNVSHVTVAKNVRFGRNSGMDKRSGTQQKGNQIGTSGKILGLHSYIKKDTTAKLLATYGSDIYQFNEANATNNIATSSNAQGTGYSKDNHMFFTSSLDANGKPWLVVTYQSGSGIILEWSAHPYSSWANTPITIDTSTQLGWSLTAVGNDAHVVFMSDANTVKYVKLTYSAGPTWAVGTKVTVAGSGASDSATNPTLTTNLGITIIVGYRYFDGTNYSLKTQVSTDSGATFPSGSITSYATSTPTNANVALAGVPGTTAFIIQTFDGTTWTYAAFYSGVTTPTALTTNTSSTLNVFKAVAYSTDITKNYYIPTSNTASGISMSVLSSNTEKRVFDVVNDGVNDNDIEYRRIVSNVEDSSSIRVTNNSNNNLYPQAPENFVGYSTYVSSIPVMFMVGTSNPYTITLTSLTQWVALSASLTANKTMRSALFPFTAAGGTDQIYFVNGADAAQKWDGTTLTAAAATGYPIAKWVVAFEDRLWFFNLTTSASRATYTAAGADNFASPGTYAGGTVDFPAYLMGGIVYRDHAMLVFTREGIYIVQNFDYSNTQADTSTATIRRIPNSYGTLSMDTVKQIGYWVYFQSPDGQIRRTNGQYVEEPPVSDIIRPTINSFSLSQLQSAVAGTLNEFYFLSLTGSGAAQNETMVILDTLKVGSNYQIASGESSGTGGGFSIDTGKYASVFTSHVDSNGVPTLYFGESRTTNGTVYQMEVGTSDNGAAIDFDVQTGTKFLSSSFYKSRLRDILVKATASGNWNLTIGVARSLNNTSFANYLISLSPAGGVWGIGKWGTGIWGGNTTVEGLVHPNLISRGF